MSTFLLAFLVALGGGTWIFTKVQRSTGGTDPKQSGLFGAIAGVILFILILMISSFLPE